MLMSITILECLSSPFARTDKRKSCRPSPVQRLNKASLIVYGWHLVLAVVSRVRYRKFVLLLYLTPLTLGRWHTDACDNRIVVRTNYFSAFRLLLLLGPTTSLQLHSRIHSTQFYTPTKRVYSTPDARSKPNSSRYFLSLCIYTYTIYEITTSRAPSSRSSFTPFRMIFRKLVTR